MCIMHYSYLYLYIHLLSPIDIISAFLTFNYFLNNYRTADWLYHECMILGDRINEYIQNMKNYMLFDADK